MPDVFDDLDTISIAAIGDAITYTPAGGSPRTVKGWVDHRPDLIDFEVSSGVSAEATIEVNKSDIAVLNKDGDRFTLPRTGKTYKLAAAPQHSKSGRQWLLAVVATAL